MDIHTITEGCAHSLILRDMGKDSQLDLAVVCIHQDTAGFGDKHLPDLRAQIGTDGDILQIRLGGRQPSGGRHQILEGGVDTAIPADLLDQPLSIGGFQFRQHPVIHDGRNDRVLGLQFFQHIGVGGIAGLGLLHRRQSQLVKKQFSQLFGGIDVEFLFGIREDQVLTGRDPLRQHGAKLLQLLAVDIDAQLFHPVQHTAQRQFNIMVQGGHTVFLQFRLQHRPQMPQGFRTGSCVAVFHADPQEIGSQLGNGIVRLGRIQIIGSQGSIETEFPIAQAQFVQPVHGGFDVVRNAVEPPQQAVAAHLDFQRCYSTNALFPGNTQSAILRHIHRARQASLRHFIAAGKLGDLFFSLRLLLLRATQTVTVDQADKLQSGKQLVQRRPVIGLHDGILRLKIDGCFRTDSGQIIGKIGVFFAAFQLFPHFGFDGGII